MVRGRNRGARGDERYGRAAIVVGGTGLYFNALTRGLAEVPPIPAKSARAYARASRVTASPRCMPNSRNAIRLAAARLMPGDRARIARALEVVLATGRSLLDWHEEGNAAAWTPARGEIFLMPDRDELLRRVDARFDAMIREGALEEVRALAARNLDPELPAMKATACLGSFGILAARSVWRKRLKAPKRDTRQYTKRQATWFRNQLPEFTCRAGMGACRGRGAAARDGALTFFRGRGRLYRAVQPDGVAKWPVWMETRRRARNRW